MTFKITVEGTRNKRFIFHGTFVVYRQEDVDKIVKFCHDNMCDYDIEVL